MYILAADIGGTYSRFALFEDNPLRLIHKESISSQTTSFSDILQKIMATPLFLSVQLDMFILAIAGPIYNQDKVKPSNLPYPITKKDLLPFCQNILFINDLEAQAWACLTTAMSDAILLFSEETPKPLHNNSRLFSFSNNYGRLGIIGAGTGLGMAVLESDNCGKAKIITSEGGHSTFPFITSYELDFGNFICQNKKLNYARLDDVLSGSGLTWLHLFLTKEQLQPEEITLKPDFILSETCAYFSRFYARICRSLALFYLTLQGIIITGGLAAKCSSLVNHTSFKEEFINIEGEHKIILSQIPIWLNCNDTSGLWGAAQAGIIYFLEKR